MAVKKSFLFFNSLSLAGVIGTEAAGGAAVELSNISIQVAFILPVSGT